jgi:2-enoate reductase
MEKYRYLFTPMRIGNCEIKNRVVLTAMEGTGIVENMFGPRFNKKCREYYIERAKNDIGLMIPGMLPVYSMMMRKWTHKSPKVFEKAKPLIEEIHSYGSKVFFQIGAGFMGRNYTLPAQLLKVAGNPTLKKMTGPIFDLDHMMVAPDEGLPMVWAPQYKSRALTKEEIAQYVEGYAKTAKLCKAIGVDGVEVHAVHEGYLMDQFTTKYTNHRNDEYGGSFENRYRFATDVVKAIKKECGEDYPVMLRFSVTSKVIDFGVGAVPGEEYTEIGRDLTEAEKAAKYLQDAGYDALDCDNGTYDSWYWAHPPLYMPLNCNLTEAEHIKKFVDIPVIVAGRMQADTAEKALAEGRIDGIGIARQFLCDPEYLTKLKSGREKEIRPCISCHNGCLPTAYWNNSGVVMDIADGSGRCAINPVTLNEKKYRLTQAKTKKKIAIIGGGIGGMEAARLLAQRGHTVTIYEKRDKLGGVFIAGSAPPFKEKDKELLEWYRNEIKKLSIKVEYNREIESLDELDADEIVIATGAKPRTIPLSGFEKGIEAIDYLLGNKETGENVAVIGGGLTGCEIAYDLCLKGKKPFIVEMTDNLIKAGGICMANSSCLKDLLRYHKVPAYLESRLKEIKDESVVITTKDGDKEIPCDSVILCIGYDSDTKLYDQKKKNVHIIGDAAKVGNLKTVIRSAYELAYKL